VEMPVLVGVSVLNFELAQSFLPRDASAERGDEIACRLSVCPSVRNVQVP